MKFVLIVLGGAAAFYFLRRRRPDLVDTWTGEFKETVGSATDNPSEQLAGVAKKAKGRGKRAAKQVRDKLPS